MDICPVCRGRKLKAIWCGSNDYSHGHSNNDHKIQICLKIIRKDKFMHIQDGDLIVGEELAHFGPTKSKAMDRFEGIASCKGKNGKTLLFLISDDNLPNLNNSNQRTLLLMFELSEDE